MIYSSNKKILIKNENLFFKNYLFIYFFFHKVYFLKKFWNLEIRKIFFSNSLLGILAYITDFFQKQIYFR